MNKKILWMSGMIIIIVCLVLTNIQMARLSHDFKIECKNYFDIDDPCPCIPENSGDLGLDYVFFNNTNDSSDSLVIIP